MCMSRIEVAQQRREDVRSRILTEERSFRWEVLGVLLLLIPALAAAAQPVAGPVEAGSKPAWRWSVDERLARRFDPESMKARAEKRAAELEDFEKRFPAPSQDLFATGTRNEQRVATIQGNKNPELFLTIERILTVNLKVTGVKPADDLRAQGSVPVETPQTVTTPWAGHGDGGASPRRAGRCAGPGLQEGKPACPGPTSLSMRCCLSGDVPPSPWPTEGCRGRPVTSLQVGWRQDGTLAAFLG